MAHQTGIKASEELHECIVKALDGNLRMLQVFVDGESEQLVPGECQEPKGSWEDDYDKCILPYLQDDIPCYVFYRLDERNAHDSYLWIFLTYTPDYAKVQQKMLYAATKATMKKSFDSGVLIDDIAATSKDEMSLNGYHMHVASAKAPPPLTREEEDLKIMMESEDHTDIGTTTKQSHFHLHGLAFPIEDRLLNAFNDFKEKNIQYLQCNIDTNQETILLGSTVTSMDVSKLPELVPADVPRYHLYRFNHSHDGDFQEAIVFIYSNPGFKSSVKERMLYSSCKESLISTIEEETGISFDKKIECDDPSDLSEDYLMYQLHPPVQAYSRRMFDKPKPPARKGNRKT